MRIVQLNKSCHYTTNDGYRYSAYRTPSGYWAPERVTPDGSKETLGLVPNREDVAAMARKHEAQQRDLFSVGEVAAEAIVDIH